MYIFKNAIKNIGRNIGRNIILLMLSTLIITMSIVSMLLHNYAITSANYYTSTYGSKVTIVESLKEKIDKKTFLSFTESSLLNKGEKNGTLGVIGKNIKVLDQGKTRTLKWSATTYSGIDDTFDSGEKKIVEGRKFDKQNEVMISKRLATLNQLHVGDTFTISNQTHQLSLYISGIYNNISIHANENLSGDSYTNSWNEIYTSWNTMQDSSLFDENVECSIELYLKNPTDLTKLREELLQKGMPKSYILTQDMETYEEKMQPVYQLQDISMKLMYAAIGVGGTLLVLISIMSVRERKYEVGILRSMGMKKNQIVRNFLYESFIMTTIALIISFSIAIFIVLPVLMNMMNQDTMIKDFVNVSLSYRDIMYSMLLSLMLALISSAGGLFIIMRYEPRQILSEKD